MTQTPAQLVALRAAIVQADPRPVEDALLRLLSRHPGEWMTARQKFATGTNRDALRSTVHPYHRQTSRSLFEYVAASVFLHTSDSWALLGRALGAFTSGDLPIATHLLYYAELRATQALLARQGLVLFDKNPFVIGPGGRTAKLGTHLSSTATHSATWEVFGAWSDVFAAAFIGTTIRVSGTPLSEWADARPSPVRLSSIAPDLMRQWGLDLARMQSDRTLRNAASYEPTRLSMSPKATPPSAIEGLLADVWQLLEPSAPSSFDNVDRRLLRHVLRRIHLSVHGSQIPGPSFDAEIEQTVERVNPASGKDLLKSFLRKASAVDQALLEGAANTHTASDLEQLRGMLGRSLVLARFATGATRELCDAAGVSPADVLFWIDDSLIIHGIDFDRPNYVETWQDLSSALEDIEDMRSLNSTNDLTRLDSWSRQLNSLSRTQHVPAWAFSA